MNLLRVAINKRLSRAACIHSILWLSSCALADSTLQFPENSVGEISSRPASAGHFGYSLDSAPWDGWEPLGQAQGAVAVPDGHVVSLRLNRHGSSDLSWVDGLERTALVQLIASRIELDDNGFARISRLSGLQHLDVSSNPLTSAIGDSLARFRELQYLWLSHSPDIDDVLMSEVAKLPRLEQVGIWSTAVTDRGLSELAGSRSLRAVYAGHIGITDQGVAALVALPTLRALRLNSYPQEVRQEGRQYPELTDHAIDALCNRPELELLDLSAAQISDEGLGRLARHLTHLRRLVLDHTPITSKGLLHVSEFDSLEDLRCYHLYGDGARFDDSVAISLSGMNSLKAVRADVSLTDEGVIALAKLPSLETLNLSGGGITDASMPNVAAMRALNDLSIQHTRVTDEGFALLQGSRTIRRIHVTRNRMTTQCIETLATMPNLKQAGLMTVAPRTDGKPIWQGIDRLTQLEDELWITGCPKLSGDDFAAVARMEKLRTLRIEGRGVLSDSNLLHLRGCHQLERLALNSTVATDQSMEMLAQLPKLQWLSLSCLATDDGLHALTNSLSLRWLTLASPNLTDEAFERAREASPRLESIRRDEFRLAGQVVSRSKSNSDPFWRLGTSDERLELNQLEGEPAPEIMASRWANGPSAPTLSELRGKVVLIDFWGSWCGPCLAQLPEIRRLRDQYAEQDLVVLGVHSTDGADDGEQHIQRNDLDWPIAFDDSNRTAEAYRVPGWPSLYLIDRQGRLRMARPMPLELDAAIESLLAE